MRPITFWFLVAAAIFAAMCALWGFSEEEPEGAVLVISAVLFWGSGLVLIVLGLVALSRWRRAPGQPARRTRTSDSA